MDFGGLERAESAFSEMGVRLAPISCDGGQRTVSGPAGGVTVLPTANVDNVRDGSLNGLVVPGGILAGDNGDSAGFKELVEATRAQDLPVMAFGDAVPQTLKAMGLETDRALPDAILLHDGVRVLETMDDLRDAMPAFFGGSNANSAASA